MKIDRQANDFLIQVSEKELMELCECIEACICEHEIYESLHERVITELNKLHFFDEYMCERCKKSNVEIKDCPYCGRA
jgi:hypothetical protein